MSLLFSLAACGGSVTLPGGDGDGDGNNQESPGDGEGDGDGSGDGDGNDPNDGDPFDGSGDGDGDGDGDPDPTSRVVPLYDPSTQLDPETLFDRGDAIVTRFGDRGRDRHAREDQFQSYDHYLPHYWEYRTARYMFVDKVSKGESSIEVSFVSEWKLSVAEFRAWYNGRGTVAAYTGNYARAVEAEGPATFDNDLKRISDQGTQYKYTYTIHSAIMLNGEEKPLEVGQFMEFEPSQFLDGAPGNRQNYYGTTYLYEVGKGGLVPWRTVGSFEDQSSEREDSRKIDERGWLGGRTTLPYQLSGEPDNNFMQMATNLSSVNAQNFVNGRRVHHTNMLDGSHDESAENGTFDDLVGIAGPNYVHATCDGCHKRNGRAPVANTGESLDKWVFKVAGADGAKHPMLGGVLQPLSASGGRSAEGDVSIARWNEQNGLRSPEYQFTGERPALFSARLAPQLVGMGLLDAIPESAVEALEDADDRDGDGISGRINVITDPVTGQPRLGRFGWKGGASSLKHQVAGALNTDMGVMTTVLPKPDCGSAQGDCGNNNGAELSDDHLNELVKYVSLLGVRARRDLDDGEANRGEELFGQMGCASCHKTEFRTTEFAPLTELRSQTIHPYTDLLLHDMGPGLADNLGEGEASGAEWRTTPLWGIGLSPCVTGGVVGDFQRQTCSPHTSYLHDGRARSLEEAILWHGGEGQTARDNFANANGVDKAALLKFLSTL